MKPATPLSYVLDRPTLAMSVPFALLGWLLLTVNLADDPYITHRYAENLVHGAGFVFNRGGEVVDGFSSASWLALSVLIQWFGFEPGPASRLVGVFVGGVGVCLTIRLAREAGVDRAGAYLAALLLMITLPWTAWAVSGLETPAVGVMVALVVSCLALPRRTVTLVAASAVLVLLLLTRPESPIYVFATFIALLSDHRGDVRKGMRECAIVGALTALLFAPYFIWHLITFHHPFPNTYYAKVSGLPLESRISTGLRYTLRFVVEWGLGLAVASAIAAWRMVVGREVPAVIRYSLIFIAVHVGYVLTVGADVLYLNRFFVPILPLLACVAAFAHQLVRRDAPSGRWAPALLAILLMAPLPGIVMNRWLLKNASVSAAGKFRDVPSALCRICPYLSGTVPPGAKVAVYRAGFVPFFTGLPAVDLIGLNDTRIARAPRQSGAGFYAIEYKLALDLWLPERPAFIETKLAPDLFATGTLSSVAEQDLLLARRPEFTRDYQWLRSLNGEVLSDVWLVRRGIAVNCQRVAALLDQCDERFDAR